MIDYIYEYNANRSVRIDRGVNIINYTRVGCVGYDNDGQVSLPAELKLGSDRNTHYVFISTGYKHTCVINTD